MRQTAEKTNGTNGINNSWFTVEYGYDLNNNITRLINKTLDRTVTSKYTYSKDNLLTKFEISSDRNVTYTYDGLNRLTGTSMSTETPIDTAYTYYDSNRGSSYTTNKLETETINGVTYKYIYDTLGNITDIYRQAEGGTYEQLYYYEYDLLNQLTYVSDYENKTVYMYSYDTGGNITAETVNKIGANGTPSSTVINRYTYGDSNWTDKLTAYNGQSITYDAIGNPMNYRDGITMTWKNGRQLATLNNSDHSVSYSYDSNSVRLSKTVDGVKYTYAYLNGMLIYETRGEYK